MTVDVSTIQTGPSSPLRRIWRWLQSFDEALARTEADDLRDRIRTLELRVDALAPQSPLVSDVTIEPASVDTNQP